MPSGHGNQNIRLYRSIIAIGWSYTRPGYVYIYIYIRVSHKANPLELRLESLNRFLGRLFSDPPPKVINFYWVN